MDCALPDEILDLKRIIASQHLSDSRLLQEMASALGLNAEPCQKLDDIWDLFAATELQLLVAGFLATDIERIRLLRAVCQRVKVREIKEQPVMSSWQKLLDYAALRFAGATVESLTVLFLDRKNRLMFDQEVQRGTVDHTPCYPREIARMALLVECSSLILLHNHPSGDPAPSRGDVEMTKSVDAALKAVGIVLHDHLIVGSGGRYTSFKSAGLF